MDLGLLNRHAVVTGASRGLGRAIAAALAAEGANVVAVARNLERLNELAASAPPARGTITARACDLADASSIAGLSGVLQEAELLPVKQGAAVVQIEPIEGPGMCGADFPLKVAALGTSAAIGYGEEPRPPSAIRNPNPLSEPRYGAPIQTQPVLTRPVQGEIMRWTIAPIHSRPAS